MKKSNLTILITILLISVFIFIIFQDTSKAENNIEQEYLYNKIIRFHVIANSDNDEDQNLKLKVRDRILEYMSPKLNKCNSIQEARKTLKENDSEISKIAEEVVMENGYNYKVQTTLSKESFPIKSYGNITLPQGKYEAYRVIIGDGNGQNWWCVMFPPLCFTDITRDETLEKESENKIEEMLSEEYKINNNKNISSEKITIKFKTKELLKAIKNF